MQSDGSSADSEFGNTVAAEHHAHCTLDGDSSIAHVLVAFAAEFSSDEFLDGATSPEEFLGAHAFNAVKGLATEKDLGATKLETSNRTASSKVELHKLLVVFGASDLMALLAITLLLSLGPLCLRGHCRTLDSKRAWRRVNTPEDLVVGVRAGLHNSIVGVQLQKRHDGAFQP